jgi:hypothetical protein
VPYLPYNISLEQALGLLVFVAPWAAPSEASL